MADILEKEVSYSATDVTLVTTAETLIITSPRVKIPTATARVLVKAQAQLTNGTGTTAVTPRIRRGPLVTDPVVGDAIAEQIKTAAGSTEPYELAVSELVQDLDGVQYSFTLAQTAASANGTALQASIEVEVLNG